MTEAWGVDPRTVVLPVPARAAFSSSGPHSQHIPWTLSSSSARPFSPVLSLSLAAIPFPSSPSPVLLTRDSRPSGIPCYLDHWFLPTGG